MSIQTQKINSRPRFTHYLIDHGILQKNPLMVVDGGARGGFEKQWEMFGEQINLIGFELDRSECDRLNALQASPKRCFYPVALGEKIGRKTFYIQPHIASSSFFKTSKRFISRFPGWQPLIPCKTSRIKTVDLDSFTQKQNIQSVDFLKLDVEGCELEIFRGGRKTLANALGISAEAVFYPWREKMPTFSELDIYLRRLGFVLFDLPTFHWERISTSPLMFTNGVLGPSDRGQVTWTQAIYLRDAVAELGGNKRIKFWDGLRILKLASLMELYNLEDCAIELLMFANTKKILQKYDLRLMVDLLTPPLNGKNVTYSQYVKHIKKVGPPRYINGLRVTQRKWSLHQKRKNAV